VERSPVPGIGQDEVQESWSGYLDPLQIVSE
jgi:hypothetical protein